MCVYIYIYIYTHTYTHRYNTHVCSVPTELIRVHAEGPHPQKSDSTNLMNSMCSEYTQLCVYVVSVYIQLIQFTWIHYITWGGV